MTRCEICGMRIKKIKEKDHEHICFQCGMSITKKGFSIKVNRNIFYFCCERCKQLSKGGFIG
ncbi:MAG: TRASH domain-containing protein [Candidatus Methanofastidiosia archaeon]